MSGGCCYQRGDVDHANISRGAGIASTSWEENLMYAAIRQAKAEAGSAEELAAGS